MGRKICPADGGCGLRAQSVGVRRKSSEKVSYVGYKKNQAPGVWRGVQCRKSQKGIDAAAATTIQIFRRKWLVPHVVCRKRSNHGWTQIDTDGESRRRAQLKLELNGSFRINPRKWLISASAVRKNFFLGGGGGAPRSPPSSQRAPAQGLSFRCRRTDLDVAEADRILMVLQFNEDFGRMRLGIFGQGFPGQRLV